MDGNNHTARVKADSQTAFILGNGPSLRGVDLRALSGYATIGLNAAYRHWREIDWWPRYYACLDLVVGLSHKQAIESLISERKINKFILRENLIDALGDIACDESVVNFDALRSREPMLRPPAVTTGSHAALWAASLGYRRVVLLGIDGRYKEIVDGAERRGGIELEIVEQAENPNYFFDAYQQPGDRFNIPNPRPDLHIDAWRAAGAVFKEKGVEIFNANPQSAVRCFPYVDFSDLLASGAAPSPADEAVPATTPLAAAPAGPAAKLAEFLKANPIPLLAPVVFFAPIFAVFIQVITKDPVVLATILIVFATAWSAAAVAFYARHIAARRLNAMQVEMDGLRARIADLERLRQGPPQRPRSDASSGRGRT